MSVQHQLLNGADIELDAALKAFRLDADAGDRALITIQLSQTKQNLHDTFNTRLAEIVLDTNDGDNDDDLYAAIRILTTLFSIRPEVAHALTLESTLLNSLLNRSISSSKENLQIACFLAELINAAANHAKSRKHILKEHAGRQHEDQKIVQIDETSDEDLDTMIWLLSFMEKANVENASTSSMLGKVALLSSMAMHKLRKEQSNLNSESLINGSADGDQAEKERKQQESDLDDHLLLALAERFLLSDEALAFNKTSIPNSDDEITRICRLASVEGLAYMTIDIPYRASIARKATLLQRICQIGLQSVAGSGNQQRTLFPLRGNTTSNQTTSSYEADKALAHPQMAFQLFSDSALQYGIAMILRNITAYPPILSTEEKQMDRLRKMANAKTSIKEEEAKEELEIEMNIKSIEQRCSAVIEARGAEALSSIALSGSKSKQVMGSLALRETLSTALLSLTSKQDRLQRGKIIQQGGAKALVGLANEKLARALQGEKNQSKSSFDAIQALSQLLITEDPRIVLQDPVEAVPALLFMYLHSMSSRLQRFEAALALTNLASVDERTGRLIARYSFSRAIIDASGADDLVVAGAADLKDTKCNLSSLLHERIFLEDNEMCRRSSLELLCNLLAVDEDLFKQWSGELEDETVESTEKRRLKEGKTTKNLSFLLALCAPMGYDKVSNESGLKLRMAASGVLATLASSPSACIGLFHVEDRLLRRMSELLSFPPSMVDEEDGEGVEEMRLHKEDLSENNQGEYHAALQLALRSLTILDCLIQYIVWLQSQSSYDVTLYKNKLIDSGYIEAMKKLALSLATAAKESQSSPVIQSLHDQVASQAFNTLRISQTLHLL